MEKFKKTFLLTLILLAGLVIPPMVQAADNLIGSIPTTPICADSGQMLVTYANLDDNPSTGVWVGGTWYPNETQIVVFPGRGMVNRWVSPYFTWSHEGCDEPGEQTQKGIMVMQFIDATAPGWVWNDSNTWQEKQIPEARLSFAFEDASGHCNYLEFYDFFDPRNILNPNPEWSATAHETWGGTEVASVTAANVGNYSLVEGENGFSDIVFVTDFSYSGFSAIYLLDHGPGSEVVIDPDNPPLYYVASTAPDPFDGESWETDYYNPGNPDPLFGWPPARVRSEFQTAILSVLHTYDVYMWWTELPGRKNNVQVDIFDGDTQIDTVYVNQQTNGGQWNMLGSYGFSTGQGKIRVWGPDVGEDATVCMDAVKFAIGYGAGNTPVGTNVEVIIGDAAVTFGQITSAGDTTIIQSNDGPPPPANFQTCDPPVYYDITTTATYSGTIEICLTYDDSICDETDLHLFHYEGDTWVDVTTSVNTTSNMICGEVTSLSEFLLAIPDAVGPIIYVDQTSVGNNNGSTWEHAFTSLQDGLAAADTGKEIWVAQGIYKPTTEVGGTGDRYKTFQMTNGVAIYGGFNGNESTLNQRDVQNNETILSGDIGTPEDPSDNCYHVFNHSTGLNLNASAILDGFTITGGNADGSGEDGYGGGMFNYNISPTIRNCTFIDNSATYGGAMFNEDSPCPIDACVFIDNSASVAGGAIYGANNSGTTFNQCSFSSNQASYGGAVANFTSSVVLTGCSFSNNTTYSDPINYGYGGAIYNNTSTLIDIVDCEFHGNQGTWGGAVANYLTSAMITNTVFSGNKAYDSTNGGAVCNFFGDVTVANSTFYGNEAIGGGGAISNLDLNTDPSYTATITNSILWGNSGSVDSPELYNRDSLESTTVAFCNVEHSYPGTGNIAVDPLFVDTDGMDNMSGNEDDNLRLFYDSPCIDQANNIYIPAGIVTDLDDLDRVVDGNCDGTATVDMGAYEFDWLYIGDFAGECDIKLDDFSVLSLNWQLNNPAIDIAPFLNPDGVIDLKELLVIIEHWLAGTE